MVRTKNKNLKIAENFKNAIARTMHIEKMILFGSRARGTFHQESDFDILIVSNDFAHLPWYKRSVQSYMIWKEDYPLEVLCVTPKEFSENKGIIAEARRTGIVI